MIDLKNIKLGALPSKYDPRDWPARAAMPGKVYPLPIRVIPPDVSNQKDVGNCVAQGSTKSIELGVPGVVFVTPISEFKLDEFGVLHNDGNSVGSHLMFGFEVDNHLGRNGVEEMVQFQNSWDTSWGIAGRGWMTWPDFFRYNEVWALYPTHKEPTEFGVDFVYGRYREHRTPGMYARLALEGMSKEGIAPRRVDPGNTEVTDVITYAQQTDAERLLKAAAPYKGLTYFRLNTPDDVKAVLYEAMLRQQGEPEPVEPIVVKHTTLRLKDPYMRDRDTVTGSDVTLCQQRLTLHSFPCGAIDGVFGAKCDAAARAFQATKGLTADGIVGIKTWAALEADPAAPSKYDITAIEARVKLMVGDPYIIGGQGHELTKAYLDSRKAAKPAYFTGGRYEWLVEQIKIADSLNRKLYCEDCSGLVMHCNDALGFWPDKDLTAEGVRQKCKLISRAEVQPGDMPFRVVDGVAEHMAWLGKDGLYEAVGTAFGVAFRADIDDRTTLNRMTGKIETRPAWTEWRRPIV